MTCSAPTECRSVRTETLRLHHDREAPEKDAERGTVVDRGGESFTLDRYYQHQVLQLFGVEDGGTQRLMQLLKWGSLYRVERFNRNLGARC